MSAGDWKDLFSAVQAGDLARVRYHLDRGVDPNHQHPEILSTPLVTAILGGSTDIALCLLAAGADPRLRSYFDDLTPYEAARKTANKAVLEKLRAIGVTRGESWLLRLLRRLPFGD